MITKITEKLATQPGLSPHILDIVGRVRTVGLHKIAAQLRNKETFGLDDALKELGTKLSYDYLKQQKIASGLRSLSALHADGTVKIGQMFRLTGGGIQKLMPTLDKATQAKMPSSFGGTAGKAAQGTFEAAQPGTLGFAKKTMRGTAVPGELPAMRPLPTR
jgi:hypothetical protein